MAAPLTDVLDQGDRLIAALEVGDLDTAADALGARQGALGALLSSAPPPASDLAEVVRHQGERIEAALQAARGVLQAASSTARRAAEAAQTYRVGPPAATLDTEPRGPRLFSERP